MIHWQHPLATAFQLLNLSLRNLDPALGAKRMASAKSLPTLDAGELLAGLEMLYRDSTTAEVYIFNRQSQGLADPATEME
jgi:hypothetical protein